MTKGKGLDERQTRVRKEDGTRDPQLSQKLTLMRETTNSSPPCHELWPAPWDEEQETQRNLLPCLETRNMKTYASGC